MSTPLKTAIEQAQTIAILTHISPDGDAYGSSLGLSHVLKALGKKVCIYCSEAVGARFLFLPGVETIKMLPEDAQPVDLVITLDAADLDRLGPYAAFFRAATHTVCIDHHGTNPGYAKLNYIRSDASSTCEVLFDLLESLQYSIPDEAKVCLLCGISTDTGHFDYNSVSAHTFQVASQLRYKEMDLNGLTQRLYRSRSVGQTRLLGHVLNRMELLCDGRVALLTCRDEDRCALGAQANDFDGIVNYGIDMEQVVIAILARTTPEPGLVKVSLRAKEGFDVAQIALRFGGGGHRLAAGCSFHQETLEHAVSLLTQAVAEALEAAE